MLEHESLYELCAEAILVLKDACQCYDAFVLELIVHQQIWLLATDISLLFNSQAKLFLEELATLVELRVGHRKHETRE